MKKILGRIFLVEKTKNRKKKIYKNVRKSQKNRGKSGQFQTKTEGGHPPICECELRPAHFSLGR
jgi:hypothetical protein